MQNKEKKSSNLNIKKFSCKNVIALTILILGLIIVAVLIVNGAEDESIYSNEECCSCCPNAEPREACISACCACN